MELLQQGQELVGFEGAAFRGDAQEALPSNLSCKCPGAAEGFRIFNGFSMIFQHFSRFSHDFGAKVFRLLDDGAEIANSPERQCFELRFSTLQLRIIGIPPVYERHSCGPQTE